MLSRLLFNHRVSGASLLLKKLPVKMGLWLQGNTKPITELIKYGSVGVGSFYVIKHSLLVANCDRLRGSRDQAQSHGPLRRVKDDPVQVDWADFLSMLSDQKWLIVVAFSVG